MIPLPQEFPEAAKYLVLVLSYGALGGALKYIDQAFDAGVFSKKIAVLISVPTALLMGLFIVMDPSSATIFLAIVLGVGVMQKIDTLAFRLGVLILIMVPVFFREIVEIRWLPFGLLVLAGIGDEFSNDWADKMLNGGARKRPGKKALLNRASARLFLQRPLMKASILALTLAGFFQAVYFIAFLAFDAMYSLVAWVSTKVKVYKISTIPVANTKKGLEQKTGLSAV